MGRDDERDRRLRALRLERRGQQEELEAILIEAELSGATLGSALRDLGERGTRCGIDVGPHRLSGVVSHVGDDLVRLVADDGKSWDVALARIGAVTAGPPGAGLHRVGRGHPVTMVARARELVAGGAPVELGRCDRPEPLRGRLIAVTPDHLRLQRPGGDVLVAWPAVAWLTEG